MDANKGNINLILNGEKQFIVPVYQRTYSWRYEQCNRLWNDIVNMQKNKKEGHFVGSIVNIGENVTPTDVQKFLLIDGQQRLTTLTLLLIALRNYIINELSGKGQVNPDRITEVLLKNKYAIGENKYKIYLTRADRDILKHLIDNNSKIPQVNSNILKNYLYFYKQIERKELTVEEIYEAMNKLQIVNITLERGKDDPQAIFESLNSTGLDLKDSDLIRNYILMGLDIEKQKEIYDNIWYPMENLFNYEHQSELMDNFFRDYLTEKLGRIPKKDEVYKEFKMYHRNINILIDDLCRDIYKFAKYYTDIYFVRSSDEVLKSYYQDIKNIKMDVSYPFLLKLSDDYANNIITIDELKECFSLCISYVLRRAVCDIPTNSLNKTFATLKNNIINGDYINSLKAYFIKLDSYKRFPTNEEFKETLIKRDLYNMNRCRYILSKLESWNNKVIVSTNTLTIEHIIPQNSNLSKEWQAMLGNNWKEIQSKYLHRLGNLTLTAYNSEMSDRNFKEKLNMNGGFRQSALKINQFIIKQETWGKNEIEERANILGNEALKIWPYPDLSSGILKNYIDNKDKNNQYSLDSYEYYNDFTKDLFEQIDKRILSLDTGIKKEFKKLYVAYKLETNFVDIVFSKSKLQLFLNINYNEIIDPQNICEDFTDIGHWGNGNVKITMDNLEKIDYILDLIQQAFDKQNV